VYAFLVRPRWIVRHVLVATLVGLFALAGVWQIHRLHERRAHNALVLTRERAPEVSVETALRDEAVAPYRRVYASGRYDVSQEVVLLGRPNGDDDGNHLLTPLVEGGRAVIVDRGWVPPQMDAPPVPSAAPPVGPVVVHGLLMKAEHSPFHGASGRTRVLSLIDLRRLSKQVPYRLDPLYLLLASQSPRQSGQLPAIVKPLPLDEGPHKSYAIQWFSFIVIGLVGYAAFIRREAQQQAARISSAA
jgi:surfeit locus 1 family protein